MFEELTDLCRLCLGNENLVGIFDEDVKDTESLKDVIFLTTGVKVGVNDVISQKICRRCMGIVIKMKRYITSCLQSNRLLKDKYEELVAKYRDPSVLHVFQSYPNIRLPKRCLQMNMSPYVELTLNEVETYLKQHKKDIVKHPTDVKPSTSKIEKTLTLPKHNEEEADNESICIPNNIRKHDYIKQNPISPICIKLTNPAKTEYTIVKNNGEKNKIKLDHKRKLSSRDSSPDRSLPSTSKTRRISESSTSSEKKENVEPNLLESLGLAPSKNKSKPENESLVQISHERKTLRCDICNAVHHSWKELKKHQSNHFRCQFCKTKFKTMDLKEEHIREMCLFKKAMNSVFNVDLVKVENDLELRKRYPGAFAGFPQVPGMAFGKNGCDNSRNDKIHSENHSAIMTNCSTTEKTTNSDDKNTAVIDSSALINHISKKKKTANGDNNNTAVIDSNASINHISTKKKSANGDDDIIEISEDEESVPSKPPSEKTNNLSISTKTQQSISNNTISQSRIPTPSKSLTVQQPPPNNKKHQFSSSVVKPNVRIKHNYILDTIDPNANDLTVMKELLKNYEKLKPTKDTATQFELPSNTCIEMTAHGISTKFKSLKKQLHEYTIPVEIENGTFNAVFNYTQKKKTTSKKIDGWNHLTLIDLETPVKPVIISTKSSSNKQAVKSIQSERNGVHNQIVPINTSTNPVTIPENVSANQQTIVPNPSVANETAKGFKLSKQVADTGTAIGSAGILINSSTSSNQEDLVTTRSHRNQIDNGSDMIQKNSGTMTPVNTGTLPKVSNTPSNQQPVSVSNPPVNSFVTTGSHRNQIDNGSDMIQKISGSMTPVNTGTLPKVSNTSSNQQPVSNPPVNSFVILNNYSGQQATVAIPNHQNLIDSIYSNSQQKPMSSVPIHNNTVQPSNISISAVSNQVQSDVGVSAPTTIQKTKNLKLHRTPLTTMEQNLSNTTPVVNSAGVAYRPNNSLVAPQNSTLSASTPVIYQANPYSNPQIGYLFNPNTVYNNTSTSSIVPSNFPQFLISSTPVENSSLTLNTNSVDPAPVISTLSNMQVRNKMTTVTGCVQSSATHLNTGAIYAMTPTLPSSSVNVCNASNAVGLSNNNGLLNQSSNTSMQFIRVKNLLDLK